MDELLLCQFARSAPERGGISMELHADSIANFIAHPCPMSCREMHDLLEIDIRADRMGE
jgi:hypothetical protein